jgi:predicted nucleic acid-binding protein
MTLYFDLCALKRPFDDRSQPRVDAEASAILEILQMLKEGKLELVWSDAIVFENDADPDVDARISVGRLQDVAIHSLHLDQEIKARATMLRDAGIKPMDAVHLAFAEAGSCDLLITCDDHFQKRARELSTVPVLNPLQFLEEHCDGGTTN